jgi:hypothetical protein
MTRRMRRTVVVIATLMAMASTVLGATPAHAAVDYDAVWGWNTFAAWQAPSGNIYIAQYKASIAHDTSTGYYAWRINTRCMVNGTPATCSRYGSMGLAVFESFGDPIRYPWGRAPRTKENHKGEWIWQGDFHDTANPRVVPEFFLLTHGELSVHWTAPNKASTVHWVCSFTINKALPHSSLYGGDCANPSSG